jgi:hypothetical protein
MSTATCNERLATKSKQVQFPISNTLSFFGQVFWKDGTRPDPRRLADFLNVSQPNRPIKSEVSLAWPIVVVNTFEIVTTLLRELTKKDVRQFE